MALDAEQRAEGTAEHEHLSMQCGGIVRNEYEAYSTNLREEMELLPRGSKKWWRMNKELLHNAPCR